MTKINFSFKDLTRSALERLVQELIAAPEGQEEEVVKRLAKQDKERNDLADLKEETKGKAPKVEVEDDEDEMEEDD